MSFSKKNEIFFKIAKGGKFVVECVSYGMISLKCIFWPNYEFFWQKIRKFATFEKLEKMMIVK